MSLALAAVAAGDVVLVDDSGSCRPFSFLLSRQPKDPIGDSRMGFWVAAPTLIVLSHARALCICIYVFVFSVCVAPSLPLAYVALRPAGS